MNEELVMKLVTEALMIILKMTLPILLAGLIIGLAVGIFQATTQIQEATLSFIPKILVVFAVIFILGHWMMTSLMEYTKELFGLIETLK